MKSIGINSNYIKSLLTRISQSSATPSVIADAVAAYLVAHPPTVTSIDASKINTDSTHRFTTDVLANKLAGIEASAVSLATVKNDVNISGAINHAGSPHAPSNAISLATVKADSEITSAILLKHSNTYDHNHLNKTDLDNYSPDNFEDYDPAIQIHINAPHAPSDAVSLITVKADSAIADSLTKRHANTFKCGIATKNINDASTTQTIAHGLGRVPSIVRVKAHCVYSAALSEIVEGIFDGTNHSSISICMTEGTTTATTDNIYSSTVAELGFTAAGTTNPYNGANRQTGVISVDATNITITWTKAGTVSSNVVNIMWEVS